MNIRTRTSALAFTALLALPLAACSSDASSTPPTTGTSTSTTAPGPQPVSATTTITSDGAAGIRIGMSLGEVQAATGQKVNQPPTDPDPNACYYGRFGGFDDFLVMVENQKVSRVTARGGTFTAPNNLAIGSPESAVKREYPSAVETPAKYVAGGHDYTITSGDRSLLFATDGTKVTEIRGGLTQSVQYVEGCS